MSEQSDTAALIGARLSDLRNEHGYSLRGLAAKAGVSPSLVSDVERGKVEPSISTLNRLASALGTTITHFFATQTPASGRVIRARDRVPFGGLPDLEIRGTGASTDSTYAKFEVASPPELTAIEAIHAHVGVGSWFGDEPYTHRGQEWYFVIVGRLKVVLGDEVYFLDPGDSIWFPSTIPHRLENVADIESEYLVINIPNPSQ